MKHWTAGNWTGAQWFGPTYSLGIVCQLDVTDEPDTLDAVGTTVAAQELPIIWPARRRRKRVADDLKPKPLPALVARADVTDVADVVVSRGHVRSTAKSATAHANDTIVAVGHCGIRAMSIERDAPDVMMIGAKVGPVPITDDELLVFLMAA